jgi:UDP-glucose 4-epimerase
MTDSRVRRALVTGAAGFIGSHVADACLARQMHVVATDDLSGGFRENVPAGAEAVFGDLRDRAFVQDLWRHGPFDYVYHLAAYAAEGLSHFIRRYNYETNLIASVNLINQAVNHGVDCFVFASSIAVYGRNQTPMTEDLVPMPEDPYGISKLAVELDLKAAHELFGLGHVIFRPHNVYGEHQNIGDRYRNVIGIFMNRAMQGQSMPVFGDGTQTRAFSYIGDVAPVIARSPDVPAALRQTFNIGADQACSVNELARVVAKEMGVEPRIEYLPARKEVLHAFSDHRKAERVFGKANQTPLAEGIRKMAAWVRKAGPRVSQAFPNIEITRELPPSWASG